MDIEQLFDDLVRVEITLWGAAEDRVRADHDVPLAFLEFLRVIARRHTCRVGDIAADLAITVGGTSKVVDRLEARGYVERLPNPGRPAIVAPPRDPRRRTPPGGRGRLAAGRSGGTARLRPARGGPAGARLRPRGAPRRALGPERRSHPHRGKPGMTCAPA